MSIFSKTYQPRKIKYARSPRSKIHHKEKCQQQQHTRKVAGVEHGVILPEQSSFMQEFNCALEFTDKTSTQKSKKYEKERTLTMPGNRYSDIFLSVEETNSTLTDDVGVGLKNTSSENVSDICEVNYEELQITNPIFQSHKDKTGRSYEELQSTNPIFQSHEDKTGRSYEELQSTNPIFQSHKDKTGRSYEELQSTNPIFQSHKDKTGRRNGVSQRTELDVQMLTDMRLGIVSGNDEVVEEEEGES